MQTCFFEQIKVNELFMEMAWRALYTYSFKWPPPLLPPVPVNFHSWRPIDVVGCGGGGRHRAQPTQAHTPTQTHKNHLALSSINLQNALFKLLINTLIDLQKCHHSEAGAVECSECTRFELPTVKGWWMSVCKKGKANLGLGSPREAAKDVDLL